MAGLVAAGKVRSLGLMTTHPEVVAHVQQHFP